MNNPKSHTKVMKFTMCCMERSPVRWLPFAASSGIKLQQTKAANGIQR
jgi:hypothetical protein